MPNRRAKIRVSEETLLKMLDLPEETRVLAIKDSFDPVGLTIYMENPHWPEQPDDCESPYLVATYSDGKVRVDETNIPSNLYGYRRDR